MADLGAIGYFIDAPFALRGGSLSGVVTDAASQGCSRLVLAYRRTDGLLATRARSHPSTGAYSLSADVRDPTAEHFVVAMDDADGTVFNDLIFGRITPA